MNKSEVKEEINRLLEETEQCFEDFDQAVGNLIEDSESLKQNIEILEEYNEENKMSKKQQEKFEKIKEDTNDSFYHLKQAVADMN